MHPIRTSDFSDLDPGLSCISIVFRARVIAWVVVRVVVCLFHCLLNQSCEAFQEVHGTSGRRQHVAELQTASRLGDKQVVVLNS